jgi:hypothetical protein
MSKIEKIQAYDFRVTHIVRCAAGGAILPAGRAAELLFATVLRHVRFPNKRCRIARRQTSKLITTQPLARVTVVRCPLAVCNTRLASAGNTGTRSANLECNAPHARKGVRLPLHVCCYHQWAGPGGETFGFAGLVLRRFCSPALCPLTLSHRMGGRSSVHQRRTQNDKKRNAGHPRQSG